MIVKLLTEHHLEFLSLKGGCRGSPESTLIKMPHCWKSHALAQMIVLPNFLVFSIAKNFVSWKFLRDSVKLACDSIFVLGTR